MSDRTFYHIAIANVTADEFVSQAYGEFPEMKFVANAGLKRIAGSKDKFTARIVEVSAIGADTDEPVREVTEITGDAETVAVVVKKKVGTERKQYLAETAGSDEQADGDAETV